MKTTEDTSRFQVTLVCFEFKQLLFFIMALTQKGSTILKLTS